jgi:hypothetical protein
MRFGVPSGKNSTEECTIEILTGQPNVPSAFGCSILTKEFGYDTFLLR